MHLAFATIAGRYQRPKPPDFVNLAGLIALAILLIGLHAVLSGASGQSPHAVSPTDAAGVLLGGLNRSLGAIR